MDKIRAIITGVTGMVGEGVLHECLQHPEVEKVLVINRKPCGITHPKLTEIIHADFFDLSPVREAFRGYNACFFCLGVSSVGMKEDKYRRLTYDLTVNFAKTLALPDNELTFCYVSGMGTDSTAQGKIMWARVKGQTENDLKKLPFKGAYMFRPGYIQPTKGLNHTHGILIPISWLYPLWRSLFPRHVCTLKELGLAMINVARMGYRMPVLESKDIVTAAGS
ncbi:MAG TPA: NAD-dependent epimerase/dehydratase family protein [Chitinophagaceae bacterium]|nr:NAD-dependent epimerase/dehydratase family protein [Chitinophagaceae bacterium]